MVTTQLGKVISANRDDQKMKASKRDKSFCIFQAEYLSRLLESTSVLA